MQGIVNGPYSYKKTIAQPYGAGLLLFALAHKQGILITCFGISIYIAAWRYISIAWGACFGRGYIKILSE